MTSVASHDLFNTKLRTCLDTGENLLDVVGNAENHLATAKDFVMLFMDLLSFYVFVLNHII